MKPGDYVVVRAPESGVQAGELAAFVPPERQDVVILKKARRLYIWRTARVDPRTGKGAGTGSGSISLSAVAAHGIDAEGSRVSPVVPEVVIRGFSEVMLTTKRAAASIRSAPVAAADGAA